ncbi:MAG: tyrosine-type recombinase/integrase, partial [Humibacillus sp.]
MADVVEGARGCEVLDRHVELLHAYGRHLGAERGRSAHTRRAYLGDTKLLLTFAAARGIDDVGELRIADLRAWLGEQADAGAARSTIARRAASARTFLGWATRTGRIATDPALRLVAPKRRSTLPGVLKQTEAAALLDVAAVRADDADPVHARDRAMLELLYASGIRVGELAALDVDDLDLDQRVVRVMGKGSKERIVPFGEPARRALLDWLSVRPALLAAASSVASSGAVSRPGSSAGSTAGSTAGSAARSNGPSTV